MRLFNKKEQLIIKQLVDKSLTNTTYLPINVFDDIFHGKNVAFDGNSMDLVFPYIGNSIPDTNDMLEVYNDILSRILLIDYLEKEGLVYLVPMSTSTNILTSIGQVQHPAASMSIRPIGKLLIRYMNHPIYVSETLVDYVRSGFKTLEEQALDEAKRQTIQSKCQTKISIATLALAIMTLLASILIPILPIFTHKGNDNTVNNIAIPLNGMLNYMQNNIEGKLEGTMNNTAEIKAILSDTIVVKLTNENKESTPPKRKTSDPCIKYIKINTCRDTIVAK